jgi:hypothetical protein
VSDLEVRLVEVGGRLDHPEGAHLIANVRAELSTTPATSTHRPARRRVVRAVLVAAAAVVLVTSALPASRDAIANLFRVDGVELRQAEHRPRSTGPSGSTLPAVGSIAAAEQQVEFAVRVPADAATPRVTVDPQVPGGLVTLDYPRYRVVQFDAPPDGAVMAKFVDPRTRVAPTDVGAAPGYWITGAHHEIAYLDRDNQVRTATLQRVGHVLTWSQDGVTYRVEGPETLPEALSIAASLR